MPEDLSAEGKDLSVIGGACSFGGIWVRDRRSPYSINGVGCDRHSDPCSTNEYGPVESTVPNCCCDLDRDRWIVDFPISHREWPWWSEATPTRIGVLGMELGSQRSQCPSTNESPPKLEISLASMSSWATAE